MNKITVNLGQANISQSQHWLENNTIISVIPSQDEEEILQGNKTQACCKYYDVELTLISGHKIVYQYYPFYIHLVSGNEIGEIELIEHENQICRITLVKLPLNTLEGIEVVFRMEDVEPVDTLAGRGRPYAGMLLINIKVTTSTAPEIRQPTRQLHNIFNSTIDRSSPIFILGSGRCGTSSLSWALGIHPNILTVEETGFIPLTLAGSLAGYRIGSAPERDFFSIYNITALEYLEFIGGGISDFILHAGQKSIKRDLMRKKSHVTYADDSILQATGGFQPKSKWLDASPINSTYAPLIAKAFPSSLFIGIIRDPFEVVLSYMALNQRLGLHQEVSYILDNWTRCFLTYRYMIQIYGLERILLIDFSEFTSDPEGLVRKIYNYVREPYYKKSVSILDKRINHLGKVTDFNFSSAESACIDEATHLYEMWKSDRLLAFSKVSKQDYQDWENDLIVNLCKLIS
jgi:hypothetical protein